MMNKYALGTIVGTALLGFSNKGSTLKLIAQETYDFTFKTILVFRVDSDIKYLRGLNRKLYNYSTYVMRSIIYDIENANNFTVERIFPPKEDEDRLLVKIEKTIHLPKSDDPSVWDLYMTITDHILSYAKQIQRMATGRIHLIGVDSLYFDPDGIVSYTPEFHLTKERKLGYINPRLRAEKTIAEGWNDDGYDELHHQLPGEYHPYAYRSHKAVLPFMFEDVTIHIFFEGLNAHVFNPDGSLYEPKITSSKLRKR